MTNPYKLLQLALALFGVVALLLYPLSVVWPSGWAWHAGAPYESQYFMMIVGVYATIGVFLLNAARKPEANLSFIWFVVWSSAVHAVIMAVQSFGGVATAHGSSVGRCARAAPGGRRAGGARPRGLSSVCKPDVRRPRGGLADHPDRFCRRVSQIDGGALFVLACVGGLDGHRDHAREIAAGQHQQPRIQADADAVEVPQHLRIGVGDPGHGPGVAVAADRQLSRIRRRHPAVGRRESGRRADRGSDTRAWRRCGRASCRTPRARAPRPRRAPRPSCSRVRGRGRSPSAGVCAPSPARPPGLPRSASRRRTSRDRPVPGRRACGWTPTRYWRTRRCRSASSLVLTFSCDHSWAVQITFR